MLRMVDQNENDRPSFDEVNRFQETIEQSINAKNNLGTDIKKHRKSFDVNKLNELDEIYQKRRDAILNDLFTSKEHLDKIKVFANKTKTQPNNATTSKHTSSAPSPLATIEPNKPNNKPKRI